MKRNNIPINNKCNQEDIMIIPIYIIVIIIIINRRISLFIKYLLDNSIYTYYNLIMMKFSIFAFDIGLCTEIVQILNVKSTTYMRVAVKPSHFIVSTRSICEQIM